MACPSAPAVAGTDVSTTSLPARSNCSVTVDPGKTAPMLPEMLDASQPNGSSRLTMAAGGYASAGGGTVWAVVTAAGTNGTSNAAPRATTLNANRRFTKR